MEKKIECNIVQDLLLGYVDNTLNVETKKIIEKHLKECENCSLILQEIKSDMKQNEQNQKKEIDYLKKIRRKSKIKSIILAIGILFIIVLVIYTDKLIKINHIANQSTKSLQSNNIYIETRQIMSEGKVAVSKCYFKDGKYKKMSETYSDEGKEIFSCSYGTNNTDEIIIIDEKNKIASIDKGISSEIMNREENLKFVPFVRRLDNFFIGRIGTAFAMSIHADNYEFGREYYILRNQFEQNQRWEIWIDKQTGLPLKEINREAVRTNIPGTDITKEIYDNIQEYHYEFDIVTDEDVQVPDLTEYQLQYVDNTELDAILSE